VITDPQLRVVAHAHNTELSDADPTAPAEMNALRQLAKWLGMGRLDGHVSFANAASCSMCMSALIQAGITASTTAHRRSRS
jgi:tRNA(Arg) A34 adenosine deaminase TadA